MLPNNSIYENSQEKYLLFDTSDLISQKLKENSRWDEHIIGITEIICTAKGLVNPFVIDIGANIGAYSIPIAKSIESINGKVMCFEPLRITYYQLCANIILNQLENCYAYNTAIGDYTGTIQIDELNYWDTVNVGGFTLLPEFRHDRWHISYKNESTKTPIITLNNLELDRNPHIIKIDAEGYETKILANAGSFLEKYNYPIIIFEAWPEIRDKLIGILHYYGYKISGTIINNNDLLAQHPNWPLEYEFQYHNDDNKVYLHRIR